MPKLEKYRRIGIRNTVSGEDFGPVQVFKGKAGQSLEGTCFLQVGDVALRDPDTGEVLPSEPLYIKLENPNAVREVHEDQMDSVARSIGGLFKIYVEGLKEKEQESIMDEP